jgi:hypothetical protein
MTSLSARCAALLGAILALAPAELPAAPPGWPNSLTIVTSAPGGTYIVYGTGLAKILTDVLGLPVTAQSTQGTDQNIVLLEAGQAQLGMVAMGPALQGWNGMGEWTHGKKYRAQRALFPMYDTPFHLVVGRDSGIHSVADMAGKRVGTGPHGGTSGTYYPAVFKVLNVSAAVRNGAWTEIGTQLQNKQLDVLGCALGIPFPFLVNLDKEMQLESVAFTADEIATLRKAMPELSASVIPAGTYAFVRSDYQTIGMYNFAVAHKDLPDDLVYAIVKAVFANHDRLVAIHPSAKETLAANVSRNGFLPFHPGAARYYREIGVAIPDILTRTE